MPHVELRVRPSHKVWIVGKVEGGLGRARVSARAGFRPAGEALVQRDELTVPRVLREVGACTLSIARDLARS